jgi:hypothetical protein
MRGDASGNKSEWNEGMPDVEDVEDEEDEDSAARKNGRRLFFVGPPSILSMMIRKFYYHGRKVPISKYVGGGESASRQLG